uniref:Uncharacterized protein n=1 Tax=Onchocerca volvulus TaxID=6282 RepID=A0A8R1TU92_ONCVO
MVLLISWKVSMAAAAAAAGGPKGLEKEEIAIRQLRTFLGSFGSPIILLLLLLCHKIAVGRKGLIWCKVQAGSRGSPPFHPLTINRRWIKSSLHHLVEL